MLTVLLICIIVILALIIVALMMKGRKTSFDGTILVTETEERKLFSLELDADPDTLDNKKTVLFRIKRVV